jgi:hypothetical protein
MWMTGHESLSAACFPATVSAHWIVRVMLEVLEGRLVAFAVIVTVPPWEGAEPGALYVVM